MEKKLRETAQRVERFGYSQKEFCVRFGMSTATYFKMRARGEGPREMRFAGSMIRITEDAVQDWIRQREDAANSAGQRASLKARSENANPHASAGR
jgi:predicted DNA-binding transcriptional regulator AlpA